MLEEPTVPCPSIGSSKHYLGLCKPCDFKCRSSCRFGYQCSFCHICGPAQSRQWKKQKKSFWKQACAGEAVTSRLLKLVVANRMCRSEQTRQPHKLQGIVLSFQSFLTGTRTQALCSGL
ncbi:drp35 [Symbiodinium pilosum]|uniref:Drp35 protein n=1 Tax=Symbiodinium pilosum TaxID=2952 RepID=A0A812RVW5_SYMPI|nr:drp35 [Symbiodinium pilosum]